MLQSGLNTKDSVFDVGCVGVTARPPVLEGVLQARSRTTIPVNLFADRFVASPSLQVAILDITLDNIRHGELSDFSIRVSD